MSEMFNDLPFPFDGDRFPTQLAAYVTRPVLDGTLPARRVIHTLENWWIVTDMETDPEDTAAARWTHMAHVLDRDPTLKALANLPLGTAADRADSGAPWTFSPYVPRE